MVVGALSVTVDIMLFFLELTIPNVFLVTLYGP